MLGFGRQPGALALRRHRYAVRWLGDSCRVGRMYKTGETVHIQAYCWGADGERSIPVSMTPHSGRLAVTWNRGPKSDMGRCE